MMDFDELLRMLESIVYGEFSEDWFFKTCQSKLKDISKNGEQLQKLVLSCVNCGVFNIF